MTESLDTSVAGPGRFPSLDWTIRLAPISNGPLTLREVAVRDAGALLAHFNTPAVRRPLAPPPMTLDKFERFIRWTQEQRRAGALACFAIVPGGGEPAGIVQVWRMTPDFSTAEWGIVLGERWWGRGVGQAAARLLFAFAFQTLKVQRLEARTAPANVRGTRLMARLGATAANTQPHAFRDAGACDQDLWTVLASDYTAK